MKKFIAVLVGAVITMSAMPMAFAAETTAVNDTIIGMPNPFIDYDTLEEAEKAVGFEINVPESIDGYSEKLISVMDGKMIQVVFVEGDKQICIRKEKGNDDISGDYTKYADKKMTDVDGVTITLKGGNGKYGNATWTADGYSYSIGAYDYSLEVNEGIVLDEMLDLAETVITGVDNTGIIGIPNPFIEYKSLEEAEKAVGIKLNIPEELDGYKIDSISSMDGVMLQVIYSNGTDSIFVRKMQGNASISGDYNVYDNSVDFYVGGKNVSFKGNNSAISNAEWNKNGYSYSLYSENGASYETMKAFAEVVK